MASSRSLRALLTLCLALTWELGVFAKTLTHNNDNTNKEEGHKKKNEYSDPERWSLVPADNEPVTSLSDLTAGVYSIRLSGARSGCGLDSNEPEYLGFNNRTCSTRLSPQATAGPVMRGPSKSMMWREWMIRVVEGGGEESSNGAKDVHKIISLQAFIHPDVEDDARCHGYVSTFYGNSDFKWTCAIPPYGTALFLNASRDDSDDEPETWKIRPADGATGQFEIGASNKPEVCLGTLAVEDCSDQPSLVENSPPYFTESKKYRVWKLARRYDLIPKASPSPPPSSPPPSSPSPLPPVGPAPGPIISAPSSTTSGYVTVRVDSVGGDNRCSVSSIAFTSTGSTIGSLPRTVEVSASMPGLSSVGVAVPLTQIGYNAIYAVGKCNNGETTESSNGLSVLFESFEPAFATAPTIVSVEQKAGSETDTLVVTWAPGYDSVPPAGNPAFYVACELSGTSCPSSPTFDMDRPLGVNGITDVAGLTPGTLYDCFVVAKDLDGSGVCSEPAQVTTYQRVTAPTIVSVAQKAGSETDTLVVTWAPGYDSVPPAGNSSFYVACVPSGTSCPSSPTFDMDRPLGVNGITDVAGLTAAGPHHCFVVAKDFDGSGVCSQPASISVCDVSLNYQVAEVNGKCVCKPGFIDLNGNSGDGCEYEQTCTVGDGNPVFYQDCDSQSSTWNPFCLTPGTYDLSPEVADISSMTIAANQYRVSFTYNTGSDPPQATCNAYSSSGFTSSIACFTNVTCFDGGNVSGTNINDNVVQVTVAEVTG